MVRLGTAWPVGRVAAAAPLRKWLVAPPPPRVRLVGAAAATPRPQTLRVPQAGRVAWVTVAARLVGKSSPSGPPPALRPVRQARVMAAGPPSRPTVAREPAAAMSPPSQQRRAAAAPRVPPDPAAATLGLRLP